MFEDEAVGVEDTRLREEVTAHILFENSKLEFVQQLDLCKELVGLYKWGELNWEL